jgi:hypothetical protein
MEKKDSSFDNTIRKFRYFTSKYGKEISRITLAALCIGLIIYFMPKEKSVYYGFKPNSPWIHEQLRAEFDFDVPKSNAEIEAEKDSIKRHFIPVFRQTGIPSEFYQAATATPFTEDNAERRQFFYSCSFFLIRMMGVHSLPCPAGLSLIISRRCLSSILRSVPFPRSSCP